MITILNKTPSNMVGFRATGKISQEDFDKIVIPAVNELVNRTGELNYLMVLDTDLRNFSIGAWWKDALMGLKNITKWRRAAIVSGSEGVRQFTDIFSVVVPGEFRGFEPSDLESAIYWVAEKTRVTK